MRYFKAEEDLGRTPRVEYAGAMYHAMCRGNRSSIVGEPRRMHDEAEAERLLLIAAGIIGLDLESKDSLRHNDRRKEFVAWYLSRKTSVGQGWISERLGMGDLSNVSRALMRME